MTEKEYKPNTDRQTELAFALIGAIEDFREDITEVEIVGALQLVSWQRARAMFGSAMLKDMKNLMDMEDEEDAE